jgi:hypothetical protein
VRKYLPASRHDSADWRSVVDAAALQDQRQAGYFLDLWLMANSGTACSSNGISMSL